ncbi:hypothetical protein IWZ03DRAFT_389028 [Phyllosticta citriasiana]|uniref:Uncharacterized protein n=1 Tax=Phyllosticta citriasiana TaxID=595635 RepID=A0ABR1KBA4_9PEZI
MSSSSGSIFSSANRRNRRYAPTSMHVPPSRTKMMTRKANSVALIVWITAIIENPNILLLSRRCLWLVSMESLTARRGLLKLLLTLGEGERILVWNEASSGVSGRPGVFVKEENVSLRCDCASRGAFDREESKSGAEADGECVMVRMSVQ